MSTSPARLTEPNRQVLEALAELRLALLPQIATWLDVSEGAADRRLRRLRDAGLVSYDPVFHRGVKAAQITDTGLRRIDSSIGEPGQKVGEHRHDVGVAWLWGAARAGVFGEMAEVRTERRMKSQDARLARMSAGARAMADDGRFAGIGQTLDDYGRERRHYPDLMLTTPLGRGIAVELELSPKGSRRLEEIMSAYASDPRVDAVLYLVPDARLARAVTSAAERAGASRLVHVRRLAPGGIAGVDPAPGRARAQAPRARGVGQRRGVARQQGSGCGRRSAEREAGL